MSEAKKEILNNIRRALGNVPEEETPADVEVPRTYRREGELKGDELVTLFVDRVSEYKATVKRVDENELADIIAESFRRQGIDKLVVPEGFSTAWLPDTVTVLHDNPESPLTHHELDHSDGVISTCALAIAQTGTIILDAGEGQGRRALSLLPDYHLCIVRANQIVELVPEGFAHFRSIVKDEGPPVTFISGPSATSDIELSRVEGVHGPRRLEVLVVS